ncbi:MAG TPA: hypothetical protein VF186_01150 [Gaiellaceae bacterium]
MKTFVAAHGGGDRVRCTSGVGLPYRLRTPDYLCTVSHGGATCDELRATKRSGSWRVTVYRRDVDCVLPA